MKKIKIGMMISIFAIAMIMNGCGTSISKKEVVDAALKNHISSFDANAHVEATFQSNGQDANSSMDMKMKYIKKPFKTHIKMGTVSGNMEMYMDKDNTFIQMPGEGKWVKTSTNNVPEFKKIASGESITKSLDRLKSYEKLYKLEKKNSDYILKVKLKGNSDKKGLELVKAVFKDSMQNKMPIDDFNVKINNFNLTLTFDKDYLLKGTKGIVDIEVQNKTDKAEKSHIIVKSEETYSNVNKVKKLVIPSDVVDNAIEQ